MAQVGALDRHFSTGTQRGESFLTTWTDPVLECEQSQGPDSLRRGGVAVPSVLTNCRGLEVRSVPSLEEEETHQHSGKN